MKLSQWICLRRRIQYQSTVWHLLQTPVFQKSDLTYQILQFHSHDESLLSRRNKVCRLDHQFLPKFLWRTFIVWLFLKLNLRELLVFLTTINIIIVVRSRLLLPTNSTCITTYFAIPKVSFIMIYELMNLYMSDLIPIATTKSKLTNINIDIFLLYSRNVIVLVTIYDHEILHSGKVNWLNTEIIHIHCMFLCSKWF